MFGKSKAASLAALIKRRLNIEARVEPGEHGRFDVKVDGELIASRGGNWFTRRLGAGWPDPAGVVALLEARGERRAD